MNGKNDKVVVVKRLQVRFATSCLIGAAALVGTFMLLGYFSVIPKLQQGVATPSVQPAAIAQNIKISWAGNDSGQHQIRVRGEVSATNKHSDLFLLVPDLGVKKAVPREQLVNGIGVDVPNRPGSYLVKITCDGIDVHSDRLNIPLEAVLSSGNTVFTLGVGVMRFQRPSSWVLPVRIETWLHTREGDDLPIEGSTDRSFVVQVGSEPDQRIDLPAGQATSEWINVRLGLSEPTVVRVTDEQQKMVVTKTLRWADNAPAFQLKIFPESLVAPAISGKTTSLAVYYEVGNSRVPYVEEIALPAAVIDDPRAQIVSPTPIKLGPRTDFAELRVEHIGLGGRSTVVVQDPGTGRNSQAVISFVFPTSALCIAGLSGFIGVFVAYVLRAAKSDTPNSNWSLVWRGFAGAVAGTMGFLMVVLGWLPNPGNTDPSATVVAMLIGVAAGYAGTGVFETLILIFGLLKPAGRKVLV